VVADFLAWAIGQMPPATPPPPNWLLCAAPACRDGLLADFLAWAANQLHQLAGVLGSHRSRLAELQVGGLGCGWGLGGGGGGRGWGGVCVWVC